MDHRPLPLDSFPEQLRRNVDPAAPPQLKLMAARGLVPAAPAEMAMMLFQLSLDADKAIADQARKTAAESPQQIMVAAAGAPLAPAVLDFIARQRRRDEKVLEAVVTNRNADDATFVEVARDCSEQLTEAIAINEVRLLRTPKIIEHLYLNAHARMSTVDRLIDLAKRHGVNFEHLALQGLLDDPGYDTTKAAAEAVAREFDEEADAKFRELLDKSLEGEEEGDDDELSDEEPEEEERKKTTNIASAILNMTISEKMRMAMLGSMAEREFLVKDNNRLVHMAAATSPKVRLKDIQSWAGNRTVPDGVLSYIATHRRYRRVYQIIRNLCNNPKTPVKDSLRLFPQLVAKDLKSLMKNRNVPHQLRRQVKAMMDERERKARGKK